MVPGETATITTEATAQNGRLDTHWLRPGGMIDTTLHFPIFDRESQAIVLSLQFPHGPIEGKRAPMGDSAVVILFRVAM